jgi:hypothetical protein
MQNRPVAEAPTIPTAACRPASCGRTGDPQAHYTDTRSPRSSERREGDGPPGPAEQGGPSHVDLGYLSMWQGAAGAALPTSCLRLPPYTGRGGGGPTQTVGVGKASHAVTPYVAAGQRQSSPLTPAAVSTRGYCFGTNLGSSASLRRRCGSPSVAVRRHTVVL